MRIGVKHTEETRAKMSAAHQCRKALGLPTRTNPTWNKGITGYALSEETRAKMSLAQTARWQRVGRRKGTPEYAAYLEAKKRCNPQIKDENLKKQYSGRGIKFLFTSFDQFLADVGRRPTPAHTLDRMYNDGNYEPGNVRWATRSEQRLNQRGICGIHGPFSCPHCAAEHK